MLWRLQRLMLRGMHRHSSTRVLLLRTGRHLLIHGVSRVLVPVVHLLLLMLGLHLLVHLLHLTLWTLLLVLLLLMRMVLHLTRMCHLLLLLTVPLKLSGPGIRGWRDSSTPNRLPVHDLVHGLTLVSTLHSGHHL